MTAYSFVRISANRKTGPIPVTMATRDTCPPSCPFKNNGCYAERGPVSWQWRKLEQGKNARTLPELCALIRTIPGGSLWRHDVAGDLPGTGETIDEDALRAIVRANRGRRGFTYTHKATTPGNVDAIKQATARGFTINASADTTEQADTFAAQGLPVAVVIPATAAKVSHTPAGRKIVTCPAESSKRVTCSTCGLCYLAARPYIIGFKEKGRKHHAKRTDET